MNAIPTPQVIRLHPNDDVVIALEQLIPGNTIASEQVRS